MLIIKLVSVTAQHIDVVSLTTLIYIFFYYKANLWLQNNLTFLPTLIEIITIISCAKENFSCNKWKPVSCLQLHKEKALSFNIHINSFFIPCVVKTVTQEMIAGNVWRSLLMESAFFQNMGGIHVSCHHTDHIHSSLSYLLKLHLPALHSH